MGMKKIILVSVLLSVVPRIAFAAPECRAFENADLKDMTIEELQATKKSYEGYRDVYSQYKKYDDTIECAREVDRVQRVIRFKEGKSEPAPVSPRKPAPSK
jgi:hypothetical protein